jgi:ketosteroid isomerase-like protein
MSTVIPQVNAEVAAQARQAIAAYCQALDDGRVDDLIALFTPDGVSALPGMDPVRGHDALRALYQALAEQAGLQKHLVVNTVVSALADGRVGAVSDLVFLSHGENGWQIPLAGRYEDVLTEDDGRLRFASRSLTFTTPS